jgi:chromatin segregation and condensation protein Rec8/ScpA/Scc1 (kleisin family)
MIGMFLAILELCRQKKVLACQGDNFGEIQIELNPEPPEDEEQPENAPTEGPIG